MDEFLCEGWLLGWGDGGLEGDMGLEPDGPPVTPARATNQRTESERGGVCTRQRCTAFWAEKYVLSNRAWQRVSSGG